VLHCTIGKILLALAWAAAYAERRPCLWRQRRCGNLRGFRRNI